MITAEEICEITGGRLKGDPGARVERASDLQGADAGSISFVAGPKYTEYLRTTSAGIVLATDDVEDAVPAATTGIFVDDPHRALREVLLRLYPEQRPDPAVHPTAVIGEDCLIADGVAIGPYAVIEDGVTIGTGSVVGSHAFVGRGSMIGSGVRLHTGCTIHHGVEIGDRSVVHSGARIGKEGFGYIWDDGHLKVPQIGKCRIGEDVEIGANTTVDRGSVGETVIGSGTKIDNLVHIGHNVRIGRNVLIIAQVGISGSTTVGDGVILAGQVGVGGHLNIGSGARVGGQAGVTADIPAGQVYSGYPARPHREALKAQANLFRLGELSQRVKKLEKELEEAAGQRAETE